MLSHRTKKALLQAGVALAVGTSAVAMPAKLSEPLVVQAAVVNTQPGTLTVTAYSLWAYRAPDWTSKVLTYSKGKVLDVVEKHTVDGRDMYKLSNGYYITASPTYVSFVPKSVPPASAPAPAVPAGDLRQTTGNLNLRSGMSTSTAILVTIPSGTTLTVQSVSGTWAKVSYKGYTGYVSTTYLKSVSGTVTAPAPEVPAQGEDLRKTTGNLNLRSGMGTSYGILLTIPSGTTLTVQSVSGGWAKVSYGGKTGYVATSYLTAVTPTPTPPPETIPETPAPAEDYRQTTANLNLRSGMSTTTSILATIPSGTTVKVESVSGDWAKVSYGGKIGYAVVKYLKSVNVTTPEPPVETPAPAPDLRETTANLNLRSGMGVTYSILATIPSGTAVTVESVSGAWGKVTYQGKVGYVNTTYLKIATPSVTPPAPLPEPEPVPEPVPEPTPPPTVPVPETDVRQVTGNLNLRSGPDQTTAILAVIPKGTQVTVISLTGKWAQVTYNGKTGYASTDYMVKVAAPAPAPEVPAADVRTTLYNLNLRSGAGTNFAILLTIPKGTKLTVEAQEGSWAQVTYAGRKGYVAADYLEKTGTVTPPPAETPVKESLMALESPQGTLEYGNITVKGYLLTEKTIKSITVKVNGTAVGTARLGIARPDLAVSQGTYANAATAGFELILDKDRLYRGTNAVVAEALLADGTTVSASATVTYNRPQFNASGVLDGMEVVNYGNEDIKVTGYAKIDTGVKNVRVLLNGRPMGTAAYGLARGDDQGALTGYAYTIRRNNLFPGQNIIKVEVTGNGGETLVFNKVINVEKIPVIVIDAGHGGKDSGARGYYNGAYVYEKTFVLKFATYLNQELQAAGFKTVMTRTDDTFVELTDRAKIANDNYADLFFSIHHDYSPDPTSQGAFVIYPSYKVSSISESTISESIEAATYLKKALLNQGFKDRRNGTDASISGHTLAVLRQSQTRSILAEIGFMSNTQDLAKITSDEFQRSMAKEMAKQIKAYFGMN